jgi:hypothetical protein
LSCKILVTFPKIPGFPEIPVERFLESGNPSMGISGKTIKVSKMMFLKLSLSACLCVFTVQFRVITLDSSFSLVNQLVGVENLKYRKH